jgi:hypothetical protein
VHNLKTRSTAGGRVTERKVVEKVTSVERISKVPAKGAIP